MPGELDTLRKLVLIAEQAFEAEGILRERPVDLLREALKCVRNEVAVMGDAETQGMGTVDGMTYLRVERRIDLALALADYREEFGHRPVTVDQRDGASE